MFKNTPYLFSVLNLVINGLPSISLSTFLAILSSPNNVLNLVINGLPSILKSFLLQLHSLLCCFKPCYKWITFNIDRGSVYFLTGTSEF